MSDINRFPNADPAPQEQKRIPTPRPGTFIVEGPDFKTEVLMWPESWYDSKETRSQAEALLNQ